MAQPLQSRTSKNHYDLTLNVERQVSRESGTRTKASSLGNRWDAFFVVEKFRAGRTAAGTENGHEETQTGNDRQRHGRRADP
ncbi:hypothetical protein PXNS11_250054 [Stutzerimonas xanthomarina]|nr:hypothetical protein PXNS11_250054 [Stutzerimonas xanthomarina]